MNQTGIKTRRIRRTSLLILLIYLLVILMEQQQSVFALSKLDQQVDDEINSSAPKLIYILVDDSFTANEDDKRGDIRSVIVNNIIHYSVSYHWVENSNVSFAIYQYGQNGNISKKIWPQNEKYQIITQEDLVDRLNEIDKLLVYDHPINENDEDHLDQVLSDLKKAIESDVNKLIKTEEKSIFIITEGNLEDSINKSDKNLRIAADAAPKLVPINAVIFTEKSFDYALKSLWEENFFSKIPSSNKAENLLIISDSINEIDRSIWVWLNQYYEIKNYSDSIKLKNIEIENMSGNSLLFDFECNEGSFRMFTKKFYDEKFSLLLHSDSYVFEKEKEKLQSQQIESLGYFSWSKEGILNNIKEFEVISSSISPVSIIYKKSCDSSSIPTSVVNTDSTASEYPIGTTTPTTTSTPALMENNNRRIELAEISAREFLIGGVWGIIVVGILYCLSRFIGRRIKEGPLFVFSAFLSILFIVLLIGLIPGKYVVIESFLINILVSGCMLAVTSFSAVILKYFARNSKLVDFFINISPLLSPFIIGLFIVYEVIH